MLFDHKVVTLGLPFAKTCSSTLQSLLIYAGEKGITKYGVSESLAFENTTYTLSSLKFKLPKDMGLD